MSLRTSLIVWLFLLAASPILAQHKAEPLSRGPFAVGYRILSVPYFNSGYGSDTVQLVLNIWYPTEIQSATPVRLLDYLHYHESLMPAEHYSQSKDLETENFKEFIQKNFGAFEDAQWNLLTKQSAGAYLNAPHSSTTYPLILGRLRAFSTTYTNEFLASNGYVVCMINGVEDYPPDNRSSYYRQVTNEIDYYAFVKDYLSKTLKMSLDKTALMGFSGGGFSQFFAPMNKNLFEAVVLIESGIFLDGDLFDIVSNHPYYHPEKFETPLLFLYNKQRFEKNKASSNFYKLKTKHKYLVLFDDSTQHHWDFATEGIVSALYLNNRNPATADRQLRNFKIMNETILNFLDRYLKNGRGFTVEKNQSTIIKGD